MKENFIEDLKYFEKKNKIKIKIISENSLIIPEYIIDLQNKSKKTLEKLENFSHLRKISSLSNNEIEVKKISRKGSFKKKNSFEKNFTEKKVKLFLFLVKMVFQKRFYQFSQKDMIVFQLLQHF